MKYAIIPHILGTIFAAVLAWFLPTWASSTGLLPDNLVPAAQWTFVIVAIAWGGWKAYDMLKGRDALANKTEEHFKKKWK